MCRLCINIRSNKYINSLAARNSIKHDRKLFSKMLLSALFLLGVISISQAAVLQKYESRIINGNDVAPGEIPYQVSLQMADDRFHFCGGSILNERYVITAAHCVTGTKAEEIIVVVGTVNLNDPQKSHAVESIYYHEHYNFSNSWINDIALLKVKTPFVPSRNVAFVTLPKQNETVNPGVAAMISGFGKLSLDKPASKIMQQATIYISDQEYCKDVYSNSGRNIYDTQICANDPNIERGTCMGDSGGPLTVNGKLVGLTSWARFCALTDFPTVYTRISSYIDWIAKHAI